jgi:hypothetical protein
VVPAPEPGHRCRTADVVPDPWRKTIAVHSGGLASRAINVFIARNVPQSNASIARLHHAREAWSSSLGPPCHPVGLSYMQLILGIGHTRGP